MKLKEFIKKYPLVPVFAVIFVAVWVVYGIYEIIYSTNNNNSQDRFEEVASNAFISSVSDDTASDNVVSVSENEETGPTEEELRLIAIEQRKKRIRDFYEVCGDREYYQYYIEGRPDFDTLYGYNDEIVGYLLIPDTKIDYPILQSEENGFYLNHNLDKKKSATGCLYIENYNESTFEDPIAIIYGHDMLNDTMFGTLNKYLDAGYRKKHNYFFVYSPYEVQVYEVAITSVVEDVHLLSILDDFVEVSDDTMMFYGFNGDEPVKLYDAFVNKTISHSNTYMTETPFTADDQLVVMSTCFRTGTRFIVVGRRVV